ncbi:MAG: hypothetical protein K1X94_21145 [Sandaracinaceae bacterium]|nr:hypothetical protein [Sandaracinaceae bacterium]
MRYARSTTRLLPLSLVGCLLGCPDTTPALDAALAPDASVTTPDAPTAPDAAPACVDISGAYVWTSSCSIPEATLSAHSCITQTGCTATMLDSQGVFSQTGTVMSSATVVGNVVTSSSDGLTCTAIFDGDSATAHCESTSPAYTCDATAARVSFPDAAQYCCDVVAGECGADQRCQVVAGADPVDRFTACVPAGTLAEGEPCMRAGGRIGADECGPGLTCTNLGQLDLTVRTCTRLCETSSDCEAGESCWVFTAAPHAGVCRATCTVLGDDCPAGFTCQPELAWAAMSTLSDVPVVTPACVKTGTGALGVTCTDQLDCGPDMACFFDLAHPETGGTCRPLCDVDHACPAGEHCQARGYTNPHGYGGCIPD